jgi:ribosomal protein S18 acetylase RimI-like enzyme
MTTATTQLRSSAPNAQLRPLNPRRDLGHVADLIELCFAETLDLDGKRYLERMRKADMSGKRRWFDSVPLRVQLTAEGFVWQENGKIVGNISLIPFASLGGPIYLIANVAVHPDYRRKGIARALTNAALQWIAKRRVRSVWLQVRDTNLPAIRLYESIGFIERARRTTWTLLPGKMKGDAPSGTRIVQHKVEHWKSQRKWLRQNYPDELLWYWPINANVFRPGIWGALVRFVYETQLRQWGVEQDGRLLGILSWRMSNMYADQLWLMAPAENEDVVLKTLLPYIHWRERAQRPLRIDLPIGRAVSALQETGFRMDQTLIWMEK